VYAAPTIVLPEGQTIKGDKPPIEVLNAFDRAGGQPSGTIWSNQYGLVAPATKAGGCIVQICSGPLSNALKRFSQLLPERWRITELEVSAAEVATQAKRTQRRELAAIPTATTPTPTPAPTTTTAPKDTSSWVGWGPGRGGALFRGMALAYCLKFPPGTTPYDWGGTGDWILLPPDLGRLCLAANI
jgi:hypothetical protein